MISCKQIVNNAITFNSSKANCKLLYINFSNKKFTICIYSTENSAFSFNFSEIKLLLYALNGKCKSNIYDYNYNVESINSYFQIFKKIVDDISLSHDTSQTAQLVNESCIEATFRILDSSS